VLVEEGEVEVQLAREVLVQHRLADAGPLGDVVHGGRVVALRDEDLLRGAQQLLAPGRPRQPGAATGSTGGCGPRRHPLDDATTRSEVSGIRRPLAT